MTAHQRFLSSATSCYALCRDTALREALGDGEDVAYLDWAAVVLEAVRIQMGDAAFGPFLRCVVEAEDAYAKPLASEVIANAVLHSAAPCDVAVTRTDGRLCVEVTDTNPSLPSDVSGRGLLLVDALADAWGTQPEPWGKTTWFEITPDSSIDGLGNESADSPSSSANAVRRTDHEARMASSAESRAPFVSAPGGKRHQAA